MAKVTDTVSNVWLLKKLCLRFITIRSRNLPGTLLKHVGDRTKLYNEYCFISNFIQEFDSSMLKSPKASIFPIVLV